ncbi:hypothetical protein [Oceanobacillus timonensis]|uniref:hypothetical protein n=1 Tax=Oceanobacillus timonensis TaxID=1926285 RepID=UPI0009BC51AA|nr:hypothetical protein [Oceanobacillus timonensis]
MLITLTEWDSTKEQIFNSQQKRQGSSEVYQGKEVDINIYTIELIRSNDVDENINVHIWLTSGSHVNVVETKEEVNRRVATVFNQN